MTIPNQAMNRCEGSQEFPVSEVGAPGINRPLITFALFAYNQEKYIREAVEGALAQTYTPLQIILSDDCSTDGTFAIMEEMAAEYAGPNEILLNQNGVNLGIGSHINKVVKLSRGDFFIGSAGDDVSYPERSNTIFSFWDAAGRPICSIYSAYSIIDENNNIVCAIQQHPLPNYHKDIERMLECECPGIHGATHGWHQDVFKIFGEIPTDAITEDRIIAARSMLTGGVYYIDAPLVSYRKLPNSLGRSMMQNKEHYMRLHESIARSYSKDCKTIGWSDEKINRFKARLELNYKIMYLTKTNKLIGLSVFALSLLTGRMRPSTAIELIKAHYKSALRWAMRGLTG